jgi:hypothetical protein
VAGIVTTEAIAKTRRTSISRKKQVNIMRNEKGQIVPMKIGLSTNSIRMGPPMQHRTNSSVLVHPNMRHGIRSGCMVDSASKRLLERTRSPA